MSETSSQHESVYWMSRAQRDASGANADVSPDDGPAGISRRRFLEAAGFTLAAASGCSRSPETIALPLPHHPEGLVPGRKRYYASTCGGCTAACGLLVGTRDGRPLKMEGMPEHPLSHSGLCAVGQALPLELYDSRRLAGPLQGGKGAEWSTVDAEITSRLDEIKGSQGAVRFVTSTVTSPTLQTSIDAFLDQFEDGRHVVIDPISSSAILDAHQRTHGAWVLPHYRLDKARVILSLGADFLGTWISPVEFTAAWSTRRTPTEAHPEMSWHVQCEGRMSLTGSKADRRYRVAPDEYGILLSHLATQIAMLAQQPSFVFGQPPIPDADVQELAERLWQARGESVVLCDSQDVATQVQVNYVNHLLSAYGRTVDLSRPSRQRQGNDADAVRLLDELKSGGVAALFVSGIDLVHCLPDWDAVREALTQTPLLVSCAAREDEFASVAHFVCPDHHALESWLDHEPVSGLVSLSQPTVHPLQGTRSLLESLAKWSGAGDASAYDILRRSWKEIIAPRAREPVDDFVAFWDRAVHDSYVEVTPRPDQTSEINIDPDAWQTASPTGSTYLLTLYTKVAMPDSRHAHNPWLQELPDPITKVTWDNYVCLSPPTADKLGVSDGDVIRVTPEDADTAIELPAFIQPGQHDRVVAVALNYGCQGTDRFARIGPDWLHAWPTVEPGERVGVNAAPLIDARQGSLQYIRGVSLQKTGRRRELASTQDHSRLEVPAHVAPHGAEQRAPIQQTTLAAFSQDPHAGAEEHHHFSDRQLWSEDHPKEGHRWGMVVDLNACTGCSACVIACQSENNVPVVGRDEVRRKREMHWIRLDRYYNGDENEPDVSHQPMMCQHCDNAPCETVCPVLATAHSSEGLNEQAYNRCVGTRYCANNCPYKVRRFNWFEYSHDDLLQNLALNPDVTVRGRGVMEKCSMCVQRIEEGKIQARSAGEPLADGAIQTACQQSCPAQAIFFGDLNDPESQVTAALQDPRRYGVLEEFNFRPSVAYLRVVRNRDEVTEQGEAHG